MTTFKRPDQLAFIDWSTVERKNKPPLGRLLDDTDSFVEAQCIWQEACEYINAKNAKILNDQIELLDSYKAFDASNAVSTIIGLLGLDTYRRK